MASVPNFSRNMAAGAFIPMTAATTSGFIEDTYYDNIQEAEDEKTLKKYELAKEIKEKVKKITKYAIDNKLSVQDTLESFFLEEELDLYENFISIKTEAEEIKKKREEEKEARKKQIEDYIPMPFIPNPDSTAPTTPTPWKFPQTNIRDIDEKTFINMNINSSYTHLIS